jgi:beta-mannosidase
MGADPNLLHASSWECVATPAGAVATPAGLGPITGWLPATVPGTVAGAFRDAGLPIPTEEALDDQDWWFRCRFESPKGQVGEAQEPWLLELDGLATIADVWINGEHLIHSEAMFTPERVRLDTLDLDNELVVRFAALGPLLATRHPRPRWKSKGAFPQNLRWFRTTLLGHQPGWVDTPAPVGPWRPIGLFRQSSHRVVEKRVLATIDEGPTPGPGETGTVTVEVRLTSGVEIPETGTLSVGGTSAPLSVERHGDELVVRGSATVADIERWWPHTHGLQPRYAVSIALGDGQVALGQVGFRTVEVDDQDGRFQLLVNGVPVFCRGAAWYPVDPVSFNSPGTAVSDLLELAREAGLNMVRLPGGTVYEDPGFFDVCDAMGILVWQDAMFGFLDPPEDEAFVAAVTEELTGVFTELARHPSLAVICGGQQLEEQPAMFGLPREKWSSPLITKTIPGLVDQMAPGTPFVSSSPSGGDLPFQVDHGVSHYFGVSLYLRPLSDLRRADPRFITEGVAFSNAPERPTVEEVGGGAHRAGHDPAWKAGVHRDSGATWDLEEARNFYVNQLLGEDPTDVRRDDPERALDLGRAVMAHVVGAAIAEWRRPGSACAGLLLIGLRDLVPGAGWGIIDSLNRPKSPWFALARTCQPLSVLITDEGLNGLGLHLVNDSTDTFAGDLSVSLYSAERCVEQVATAVEVPSHGAIERSAGTLFDGFRDLTHSYRFGIRSYEMVVVRLLLHDGTVAAEASYLPGGLARPVQSTLGLQAELELADTDVWSLSVSTRHFAQFVSIDVPGFRPSRSWFHLAPGESVEVGLTPEVSGGGTPSGHVRALNTTESARVAP